MTTKKTNTTRRDFLKLAGLATMGLTSPLSSLFKLNAIRAATSNTSGINNRDYKALVCFSMSGGNDSFNMLVPRGNSEYNEYATTRSNMSLPQNELLAINPLTSDGKQYGLHPALQGIQQLFGNGELAFINNLGTLIQPTTKEEFWDGLVPLPLGLFSHADQSQQWHSAHPHERTAIGWGGRLADMMYSMNDNQNISMNISASGTNVFQYGQNTVEFSISPYGGAEGIYGYGQQWGINEMRTKGLNLLMNRTYNDKFKDTYINVLKKANDGSIEFQNAINTIPDFQTPFTDNYISESFKMVAKTIAARDILGFNRQIFFVDFGGWDHHDELLNNQNEMLGIVNNALSEFAAVLKELNVFDEVTTFSVSEFGRTLTSNGNGTDHAWGGNVMSFGGAVNGQDLYGSYPSLELDNPLELGYGVMLPTTATDLYFAELALWFGVPKSELTTIFPNIGNFYDTGSSEPPLGFLNI